jgi:isopenicillin N synthase-like dioxygenase
VTVATSLPLVDLTALRLGEPADDVVAAIDAACRDTGFFLIAGHGIPDDLVRATFAEARRFFAADVAVKDAVAIMRSDSHRGWVPIAAETLEAGTPGDLKESFDIGIDFPDGARTHALHGVNQWPDLAGFREVVEAYQEAVLGAAGLVLRGVARALGLHDDFFAERMHAPVCHLRLLHYPPRAEAPVVDGQRGCGTHTDYGIVTLLAQDGVAGLEVQRRDGTWVQAEVEPGVFVVNLGDMMARWTNDRYVSTPHRVTSPPDVHRYSIPFFTNTDADVVVECLPTCCSPDDPPRHAPIPAGDYLLSRFDDTYDHRR